MGQGLWECSSADMNSELRVPIEITTSHFDIAENCHALLDKVDCLEACTDKADGDVVFIYNASGDIDRCRG